MGCAAGLKPTAVLFAPGLLLFCLMRSRDWRQAIWLPIGLGLAFAVGFLAVWGWWGDVLWRHFHNPFFPLSGSIFPSPWAPPAAAGDPRFFPRYIWQWLFYPFFWLQGRSFIVSEEPLRDPRFALVFLALAARLGAMVWRKAAMPSPRVFALWVFSVSYALWLIGFSILRYAMPLEVISGIVIWTALRPMIPGRHILVFAIPCLCCIHFTQRMGWGRIRYSQSLVEAPVPALPPGSLVFMRGRALGFMVPYLYTPATQFISLDSPLAASAMFPLVRQRAANKRSIFVLTNLQQGPATEVSINAALASFDLAYQEAACRPVRSPVQSTIRLCRAAIRRQ